MTGFQEKVTLVTGAGSGFGKTIADKLHEAGATVVATNRTIENVQWKSCRHHPHKTRNLP
ncbi:SDR family NAD(P)-dependent oxidoreductase [Microvirga makkahensis]|uniref:SDR family NAD(P)-dependent oxidoreductase n=1 Tax=Microvirga makkahensis TaxID=1128670 RepID=A0A7X3MUS7_9HYPH|nr:SDR family NAD(P)-dependent oxidoreductase [Microvirga makkahensis]MXQ13599.1 SDR family NAD(P)-dependent oxidoreductase [Microvirga makkahensis]